MIKLRKKILTQGKDSQHATLKCKNDNDVSHEFQQNFSRQLWGRRKTQKFCYSSMALSFISRGLDK